MYLEMQTYIRINAKQGVPYSRLKSRACGTYLVNAVSNASLSAKSILNITSAITIPVESTNGQTFSLNISIIFPYPIRHTSHGPMAHGFSGGDFIKAPPQNAAGL